MKKVKLFSSKDYCWKKRETKWPNSALRPPKLEYNAFHFFISKFSYNVFWSNHFSLSKLFQDLPLHFMFFHSFKNKSVCICLRMRVHVLEHTHIRTQMQERKQKPMSPFYVSQLLLRFRLVLECGWHTHITHTEEKWFSHSFQGPLANRFLIRGGNLWPLAFLCAGLLCDLNLCMSSPYCQSLHEFILVAAMLSLGIAVSLESSTPSSS